MLRAAGANGEDDQPSAQADGPSVSDALQEELEKMRSIVPVIQLLSKPILVKLGWIRAVAV